MTPDAIGNRVVVVCALVASVAVFVGCTETLSDTLYFQSTPPGGVEDIYELDLESGEASRLTRGSADFANSFPAGSPRGSEVALVRQRRSGHDSLFVRGEAGDLRHVPTPGLRSLGPPAWSPDASQILIPAGDEPTSRRLFIADAKGVGLEELALPEGVFDCGTFHGSESQLVASRNHDGISAVVIIERPTQQLRVVAESDTDRFHCPEWSSASGLIAVTRYSADYDEAELVFIDSSTGVIHRLKTPDVYSNAVKWSPDGSALAYQCTNARPSMSGFYEAMEVCVVSADGSGYRRLTNNDHFDAHPSW